MTRVAVSILNYNGAQSTIDCVQSLLSAGQAAGDAYLLEIFVADNASAGDESTVLTQAFADFPNVHLAVNTENLGFSAGHNRNLRRVFSRSRPDYLWLLNNDCQVNEETLTALLKCAQKSPEVGIWGATLLEADGETIQCAGGCFYNSWISSYREYGRGKPASQRDELKAVDYDYVAGASLFLPLATLQNGLRPVAKRPPDAGISDGHWLNETFFLYFEELDLAKRLKPGFGLGWCRDALIKHSGGASTGTTGGKRSARAEYHSTLSALKFTRIHYPRRLWLMAPARYFSKCLQLLFRGDLGLLKPLTRAYLDFLKRGTGLC